MRRCETSIPEETVEHQRRHALDGIRVMDIGHAGTVPGASMLLGALGADVIKVESEEGDFLRLLPPFQKGVSVFYTISNLNKRGITLDIRNEEQREIVYEILQNSDVLMENMRPGVAERLGFGYESISRLNPSIIYCGVSAWGDVGPMGTLPGRDNTVQAFSGWVSINGASGGDSEFFRHMGFIDTVTSNYIVPAILLALIQRKKTGRGLKVTVSMLGAAMSIQTTRIAEYLATGNVPKPLGSACATTVPHEAFRCQHGDYIAVGVIRDEQWGALCKALRAEDLLKDERLATNAGRVLHRDEVVSKLAAIFQSKPLRWWEIKLTQARVPNSRFGLRDLLQSRQVAENEFLVQIDIPHQGEMCLGNLPWRFSKTLTDLKPGPRPGQHTEEVFRELGLWGEKTSKFIHQD